MYCFKCGALAKNEDIYCHNCGTKLNLSVCQKCGYALGENNKFCYKCGAKVDVSDAGAVIEKINPKVKIQGCLHKYKKILIATISVVLILVTLITSVSCYFTNKPSNQILGEWSTERGLDSRYLTFKSNGTLIDRPDIFTSREYDYYIKGNVLYLEDSYDTVEYYYSKDAMCDELDCWYIDNDVLYFDRRTYYRQ